MTPGIHVRPDGIFDDNYTNPNMAQSSTPAPFSYDYAGEAQKAYGELGSYYNDLLTQSKGDMNKVLSRLVEDYTKGVRTHQEDTTTALQGQDVQQASANRGIVDNALSRGLYQRSNFDPNAATPTTPGTPVETGFGIPDATFARSNAGFTTARQGINTAEQRYEDAAATDKARTTQDTTDKENLYETNLEQDRRTNAASLADQRASRAYQGYAESLGNPSLV